MEAEKFTFKYRGDLEYIDFDTLYTSQLHFAEFIREVKNSLAPDYDLKIKLRALPPASFPIELFIDFKQVTNLITSGQDILNNVGGIAGSVVVIIELYKHLKGKKSSKEEIGENNTTNIYNVKGDVFVIDSSIYSAIKSNPNIQSELKNVFDKVDKDDDVESIQLLDSSNEELSSILKNEFEYFDVKDNLFEDTEGIEREKYKLIEFANLNIFKVVFSKGFKWQFYYKGIKINAEIEDNDYLIKVVKGSMSFSNGDILVCDLAIKQVYNEFAGTYENKEYKVTKVHKRILRAEQLNLED
ncbi:hypothetical protein N7E81_19245 [Reichenbachiella carrageenanivorans]|uniref:Uncharacterized protein n=1 Tax=Reichenbachiella carrageenanivorans TaxID=2979869 RepID=A0ABY6CZZ0_9BACT|nr:hypothetical protein [Reichenbachiella carrageenanivorans]UXX78203.1 hypothetical protein N7E81_12625 [Reichenbachiella carrageenanivorans]UXX79486.1 hypothetical protein N7E81_19245 [Reichenbachiella carrageenanivorans]